MTTIHIREYPVWFSLATQNTFAIALMEQGQIGDARELLREVLADIQERCCDDKAPWKAKRTHLPLETAPLEDPTKAGETATAGGEHIFHRAFHLPQDKPVSIDIVVAVALFNYAIATHIEAITESSFFKLDKALKMYQKVLKVDTSSSDSTILDPVRAAAMYNMGNICSACKLEDKARSIRGLLVTVLKHNKPRFDAPETRAFFQSSAKAA